MGKIYQVYNFIEILIDPTNIRYWDYISYRLRDIYPYHYYINEDNKIKLKRAAKRKIFNRIIDIAQEVLTQKQYEVFHFYYVFSPRKTIDDISEILGISFWAVFSRLKAARFNILKAISEYTLSESTKQRVSEALIEIRSIRNKATKNWRNKRNSILDLSKEPII